jgi:hypothetical protein
MVVLCLECAGTGSSPTSAANRGRVSVSEKLSADLGLGAYGSALALCTTTLSQPAWSRVDRLSFRRSIGFALWRLSARSWARRVLESTFRQATWLVSGPELADACRCYLEACRDVLQDVRTVTARQRRAASWHLHEAITRLKGRTPDPSPAAGGAWASVGSYRWQPHCRGLYQTPVAA